jgi:hypothetical protein
MLSVSHELVNVAEADCPSARSKLPAYATVVRRVKAALKRTHSRRCRDSAATKPGLRVPIAFFRLFSPFYGEFFYEERSAGCRRRKFSVKVEQIVRIRPRPSAFLRGRLPEGHDRPFGCLDRVCPALLVPCAGLAFPWRVFREYPTERAQGGALQPFSSNDWRGARRFFPSLWGRKAVEKSVLSVFASVLSVFVGIFGKPSKRIGRVEDRPCVLHS